MNLQGYDAEELEHFMLYKKTQDYNGKIYRRLNPDRDSSLGAWIREEDKRVYIYDESAGKEKLLYDFTLNVGDTFTGDDATYVVIDKTVVSQDADGNIPRNKWTLREQGCDNADNDVVWVEGIGSNITPLQSLPDSKNPSVKSYVVFVYYKENTFVYDCDNTSMGWRGRLAEIKIIPEEGKDSVLEHQKLELLYYVYDNCLYIDGLTYHNMPFIYLYCIDDKNGGISIYTNEEKLGTPFSLYEVHCEFPNFTSMISSVSNLKGGIVRESTTQRPYLPTIESGKIWENMQSNFRYRTGKTTTLNETEYTEFFREFLDKDGKPAIQESCEYVREAEGKVYKYDEGSGSEYLLLDYTLNKGDTIRVYSKGNIVRHEAVVTKTYTTYFTSSTDKKMRRCIEIQCLDDETLTDIWVEGIGSLYDALGDIMFGATGCPPIKRVIVGDDVLYDSSAQLGIIPVQFRETSVQGIYSLDGRRLRHIPEKGVYIVNGRKVVRK